MRRAVLGFFQGWGYQRVNQENGAGPADPAAVGVEVAPVAAPRPSWLTSRSGMFSIAAVISSIRTVMVSMSLGEEVSKEEKEAIWRWSLATGISIALAVISCIDECAESPRVTVEENHIPTP